MALSSKSIFTGKFHVAIIALLCCLLWGIGFPMIKVGYEALGIHSTDTFGQLLFAGIRFSCAGIIALSVLAAKNGLTILPPIAKVPSLLVLALVYSVLQYVFQYIGISSTAGSTSSIINQSGTFFLVFLSPLFIKEEKLSVRKVIGSLIGFAGIILVNFKEGMSFAFSLTGEGFLFLASLMSAAGFILSKKLTQNLNAAAVTASHQIIGGAVLIAIGLMGGGRFTAFSLKGFLALAFLIVTGAFTNSLWLTLIKYNDVAEISVYKLMVPIFGVIFSEILLKENVLTLQNILALITVCLGIATVNKIQLKKRNQETAGGQNNDNKH